MVPIIDPNFDYLSELNKFALIEDDKDLYNLWSNTAMAYSSDENVFDYLWSKVKRQRGATDLSLIHI